MGEFFEQYFVSSYQQAGDFQVTRDNGRLRKEGGNVVSYFCTPEGRVIHAVGGPVSASRLLREGRWAVDTYQRAQQLSRGGGRQARQAGLAELVRQAHLEKLSTDRHTFQRRVREELPRTRERMAKDRSRYAQSRRVRHRLPAADQALLRAAERSKGERAHQLLAAFPLALYRQVAPLAFETLTNERITLDRRPLLATARSLRKAQERGLPAVLAVYRGQGPDNNQYDQQLQRRLAAEFRRRPLARPLAGYRVAMVPQRQLAALSNLLDIPVYEVPRGSKTSLLVLDPQGRQVARLCSSTPAEELASQLWPPLQESRLARAQELAEQERHSEALRLLRRVLASPHCSQTRQLVQQETDRLAAEQRALNEQKPTQQTQPQQTAGRQGNARHGEGQCSA